MRSQFYLIPRKISHLGFESISPFSPGAFSLPPPTQHKTLQHNAFTASLYRCVSTLFLLGIPKRNITQRNQHESVRHVEKRCEKIPKSTQCSLLSLLGTLFSIYRLLFVLAKGVTTPLSFREKRRMPLFRRLINEKTLSLSLSFWFFLMKVMTISSFTTLYYLSWLFPLSKDSLINEEEKGERAMFLSRILRNITDISFSSNVLVFDPLYCTISPFSLLDMFHLADLLPVVESHDFVTFFVVVFVECMNHSLSWCELFMITLMSMTIRLMLNSSRNWEWRYTKWMQDIVLVLSD